MESKEEMYKSFKDYMEETYDKIFKDENKKLFNINDAFFLLLFSISLNSINAKLYDEFKKKKEE